MTITDPNAAYRLAPDRRDILSRTQHTLNAIHKHTDGDIRATKKSIDEAIRRMIYAGFGFKVMRQIMREITPSDFAWKRFIESNFTEDALNVPYYITIGEHFNYDDSYLKFLDGCHYAVPHRERDKQENLSDQIERLRQELKKESKFTLSDKSDLFRLAKNKAFPKEEETEEYTPSHPDDPVVSKVIITAPDEEPKVISEKLTFPEVKKEESLIYPELTDSNTAVKTVAPVDVEEEIFKGCVKQFRDMLKVLQTARNLFNSIVNRRPLDQWGNEIRGIKEDLKPAKEILDQLFDY